MAGGRLDPFSVCLQCRTEEILRRGHPSALSSVPIPRPSFSPLPALSPGSSGPKQSRDSLLSVLPLSRFLPFADV